MSREETLLIIALHANGYIPQYRYSRALGVLDYRTWTLEDLTFGEAYDKTYDLARLKVLGRVCADAGGAETRLDRDDQMKWLPRSGAARRRRDRDSASRECYIDSSNWNRSHRSRRTRDYPYCLCWCRLGIDNIIDIFWEIAYGPTPYESLGCS